MLCTYRDYEGQCWHINFTQPLSQVISTFLQDISISAHHRLMTFSRLQQSGPPQPQETMAIVCGSW